MKKSAFSVAEAMVALLIASVALGASAPIITKQIKSNNVNDAMIAKLQKDIDALKAQITKDGVDGENGFNGDDGDLGKDEKNGSYSIPTGAVLFFEGDCPNGSIDMSDTYAGRYVRVAGSYNICDKQGENENGICIGESKEIKLEPKTTQGEALRRITGTFTGMDADVGGYMGQWGYTTIKNMQNGYVDKLHEYGFLSGAIDYVKSSELDNQNSPFSFPKNWQNLKWRNNAASANMYDTSSQYLVITDPALLSVTQGSNAFRWFLTSLDTKRVAPTDEIMNETRPKTIVLKACKF